jgi:phosphoacetylglucosamine mutase
MLTGWALQQPLLLLFLLQAYANELANAESDEELAKRVLGLLEREGVAGHAPGTVLIAHDTRPSGPDLAAAAAAGVGCLGLETQMCGLLTTPQLHWAVMRRNRGEPAGEADYYAALAGAYAQLVQGSQPLGAALHVDCANGVGAPKAAGLGDALAAAGAALPLDLRNLGEGVLNGGCGSDFLQKDRQLPENFGDVAPGARCCALDGDADRLMYFSPLGDGSGKGGQGQGRGWGEPAAGHICRVEAAAAAAGGMRVHRKDGPQWKALGLHHPPPAWLRAALLFDGDRIACLSAMLVQELIGQLPPPAAQDVRVGIIQTAYANGAASRYIRDNLGCAVEVTPTGVKYLHEAAHRYDVGVYFEANGHGTVLFSKALLARCEQVRAALSPRAASPASGALPA